MKTVHSSMLARVAGLVACCGSAVALAAPVMDGQLDGDYRPLWINTNLPPERDATNPGGVPCDPLQPGGDVLAVNRGIEYRIPFADIGLSAGSTATVKLFVSIASGGHNFWSNQTLPGLPAGTANLGEVRAVNLNTQFPGAIQGWADANLGATTATAPTMDGQLDASYTRIATNLNRTGFGNNSLASSGNATNPAQANGSETAGLYYAVSGDALYVFIAGNLESNFNKMHVWVDSVAGGSNQLPEASTLPDTDFSGLRRMGGDIAQPGSGLRFDTGFDADYVFWFGHNGNQLFLNRAQPISGGAGAFVGCGGPLLRTDLTDCGGPGANGLNATLNNDNIGGVSGACPDPQAAGGSELNALYGFVDFCDNRLYLFFAGNLETGGGPESSRDGAKLHVFFDAAAGGQNSLKLAATEVVDISYGNLLCMGGLTFDAGFEADYWVSAKNTGNPVFQVMDAAVLRTDGKRAPAIVNFRSLDHGAFDGGPIGTVTNFDGFAQGSNRNQGQDCSTDNIFTSFAPRGAAIPEPAPGYICGFDPALVAPTPAAGLLTYSANNINRDGITSTTANAALATSVTTGFEISVDLDELGWDGDLNTPIKVAAFITKPEQNCTGTNPLVMTNQVVGGQPTAMNADIGAPNGVNFQLITGDQFVSIDVRNPVDFNGDTAINDDDLGEFITSFFEIFPGPGGFAAAPCPDAEPPFNTLGYRADINRDCSLNDDDLGLFITLYFADGCL